MNFDNHEINGSEASEIVEMFDMPKNVNIAMDGSPVTTKKDTWLTGDSWHKQFNISIHGLCQTDVDWLINFFKVKQYDYFTFNDTMKVRLLANPFEIIQELRNGGGSIILPVEGGTSAQMSEPKTYFVTEDNIRFITEDGNPLITEKAFNGY